MFTAIAKWIDSLIYKKLRKHPLVESAFVTYGVSTDDNTVFEKNPVFAAALGKTYKLLINNNLLRVEYVDEEKGILTVMHVESHFCVEVEKAFFDEFMVLVEDVGDSKAA